eukprot:9502115-Pyramimonas_sp.AAC.1
MLQSFLVDALHCPMPSGTDSCAIAGMMDLFRTQGDWFASVRLASAVRNHPLYQRLIPVSYTHLRAHETGAYL